jgi:hypothetical protein
MKKLKANMMVIVISMSALTLMADEGLWCGSDTSTKSTPCALFGGSPNMCAVEGSVCQTTTTVNHCKGWPYWGCDDSCDSTSTTTTGVCYTLFNLQLSDMICTCCPPQN